MSEDTDYAVIGCTVRAALQQPEVPSQETACHACGTDLWISDLVLELIARDHPEMEVRAYCFYTCMPLTEESVTVPTEQRQYLREHHNLSDSQIDDLIILSEAIRRHE